LIRSQAHESKRGNINKSKVQKESYTTPEEMPATEDRQRRQVGEQNDGPDQETMEQYLQRVEIKAKKSGKEFKKTDYEKRFNKLDANKDGILTSEERSEKTGKEHITVVGLFPLIAAIIGCPFCFLPTGEQNGIT
jgi:hypothetical protein